MQLAALDTAGSIDDMDVPGFRLHPLKGDERAAPPTTTPALTRHQLDNAFLAALIGRPVPAVRSGSVAERALLRRLAVIADPARFDPQALPRLPSVLPALLQQLRAIALPIWRGEHGQLARHAAPRFVTHAEHCAAACMADSRDQGERFESYLAGLFAFTGALPLLRAIDREPGLADTLAGLAWSPLFETGISALSARAADHWQLPVTVVQAIAERGGDEARPRSGLGLRLDRADHGVRLVLIGAVASPAA
jgi:hypothetical protein